MLALPSAREVDRVALVGLPASGKSAVARALAHRLRWRLADVDALVEESAGRSVAEIFAAEGEAGFRRRELEALRRVLDQDGPLVVACGGGLMTQPEACELLLAGTCVVWLDAPDGLLLDRLAGGAERPLLRDDPAGRLAALRAERSAVYGRAHVQVDVRDGDVEDVVDRVVDAVSGRRIVPAAAQRPASGTGLHVELGERAYPVVVGAGVLDAVDGHVPDGASRVVVVADRAVAAMSRRLVTLLARRGRTVEHLPVRGGEAAKTWAGAGRLVDRLAALGLQRGDCVVAVGGGTVGDLAGFAASVYQRGIACIQVPTTLLAMVDSGIGGKTGVNLAAGKNLAGAFWQPRAVVCDLEALATLPERPFRAAFAEIVKYAMVADAPLATELDRDLARLLDRDLDRLAAVVRRCCAVKAAVVADDEREGGRRAILNYGHTVGHALEAETGYGESLLHGEAVAAGMRVAGVLSRRLLGCPGADVAWQDQTLARCGLGTLPEVDAAAVVRRTRGDKKARLGAVRWVLLERLGSASFGHSVPEDAVVEALHGVAA